MRSIDHFIGGGSLASGERQGEVFNPSQGDVQATVRLGTTADLQKAVDAANQALPGWASSGIRATRAVMSARLPSCARKSTPCSRYCASTRVASMNP